jgi:hypothetical protein
VRFGGGSADAGAFSNQAALKLSDAGKHRQDHLAGVGCRVGPRLGNGLERGIRSVDRFRDIQQIACRACKSIESPYHQRIASPELIQQALKFRPLPVRTGHFLTEDALAPSFLERGDLYVQILVHG